jgi:hypothetical protein
VSLPLPLRSELLDNLTLGLRTERQRGRLPVSSPLAGRTRTTRGDPAEDLGLQKRAAVVLLSDGFEDVRALPDGGSRP